MVVNIKTTVFWDGTPSALKMEGAGSSKIMIDLMYLPHYTVSHPRKP
jgi:hypothetical protein